MRLGKVSDPSYVYPAQPIYVPPDSDMVKGLSDNPLYVAEIKKNGWRCMVRKNNVGNIELWTRHHSIILDPLPNLRKQLELLDVPVDSILDGELMEHRGEVKEQLVLWSAIKWESKWLSAKPYRDAQALLRNHVFDSDNIKLAVQQFRAKTAFYEKVMAGELGPGNEGIVLKNLDAPVPFGWKNEATHRGWLKIKPVVLADGAFKK